MIAGLGAACGLVTRNLDTYSRHMRTVRDFLVDQLIRNFSLVTADKANTRLGLGEVCWRYLDRLCLPNTLSLRIGGFTGPSCWRGSATRWRRPAGRRATPAPACPPSS